MALEEKFEEFRCEVIDRLARIETKHDFALLKIVAHDDELKEHSKALAKIAIKVAVLAGGAGSVAGAVYHLLKDGLR
jgi:hypothetical protein